MTPATIHPIFADRSTVDGSNAEATAEPAAAATDVDINDDHVVDVEMAPVPRNVAASSAWAHMIPSLSSNKSSTPRQKPTQPTQQSAKKLKRVPAQPAWQVRIEVKRDENGEPVLHPLGEWDESWMQDSRCKDWLRVSEGQVHCLYCRATGQNNEFNTGRPVSDE